MTWLMRHAQVSAREHTVLNAQGYPDINQKDGWAPSYDCSISGGTVNESSCVKDRSGQNNGRFWPNGLQAYLSVYGLILGADRTDPNGICSWLPNAYITQFNSLLSADHSYQTWGKSSGQAFALAYETLGAMAACGN